MYKSLKKYPALIEMVVCFQKVQHCFNINFCRRKCTLIFVNSKRQSVSKMKNLLWILLYTEKDLLKGFTKHVPS